MIPRLHPRGSSFRGASAYILHDAENTKTKNRVAWTMTQNLSTKDPNWAWHEMTETFWAQGALKAASGIDQRGRKNDKPVLHYTLSWHPDDKPTPEQMKEAALSSLKALGLGEHEALIAAHTDKKHAHLHIVVNTVHPQTGRTADLKFTKLELSRWAEAYEREHGLHCEERVRNNAERARENARKRGASGILLDRPNDDPEKLPGIKGPREALELEERRQARKQRERWVKRRDIRKFGPDRLLGNDPDKHLTEKSLVLYGWAHRRRNGYIAPSRLLLKRGKAPDGVPKVRQSITPEQARTRDPQRKQRNPIFVLAPPQRGPETGVPQVRRIKHRAATRPQWIERKEVIDRMKRMRGELEVFHKVDRNNTWDRHKAERKHLWDDTKSALRQSQEYVSKAFRPRWRELYKLQREEFKFLERATPLERAVFVFVNSERLGNGKALKPKEKHAAITKPGRLLDLIEATHTRERSALAQMQRASEATYSTKILDTFAQRNNALLSRQSDERQAERLQQFVQSRQVTFNDAKDQLVAERNAAPEPVKEEGPPAGPSRRRNPEPSPAPAPSPSPSPEPAADPKSGLSEAFERAAEPVPPDVSQAFEQAAQPPTGPDLSRAEEIKQDMEEWRKNNPGRDQGRDARRQSR